MNQVKNCRKARIHVVLKAFESDSYTLGHWKLEKVMESHSIWRDNKSMNPVLIFSHHPSGKDGNHCQMNAYFPPSSPPPKLFRITRELYSLVFRSKQPWIGSRVGVLLFLFRDGSMVWKLQNRFNCLSCPGLWLHVLVAYFKGVPW